MLFTRKFKGFCLGTSALAVLSFAPLSPAHAQTRVEPADFGFRLIVEETGESQHCDLPCILYINAEIREAFGQWVRGVRGTTPTRGTDPGFVNGYPCGGDLPPCCVLRRESGGNPLAKNPRSTASGLWQDLDTTWANHAGYRSARDAPPDVQNERNRILYAGGRGAGHWSPRCW